MNTKLFVRLSTLTITFLFCELTFAQKKSLPGYYITVQGDTVKGVFPYYSQWSKNPVNVDFIVADATTPTQLTPKNSRKFVVEGYDEYISYDGQRLVNPIDDATLLNDRIFVNANDSSEQVVIFLRLVTRTISGDLYVLNDGKRTNFFYQLPGQLPVELKYKKTFDLNQIREVPIYRQQLNNLYADLIIQKKLTASLEKLPYTESDLLSFFLTLFPTAVTGQHNKKATAKLVLSAGAAVNMFSVQSDGSLPIVEDFPSSFSPLLSIACIAALDRNFGKYFLYPQIKLFRYKNTGEENQGTFINSTTYQADLLGVAGLSLGVNLVNEDNFKFFLTAGPGLMALVGGKQVKQLYSASDNSPYGSPEETELPSLTFCIDASAGIVLNRKVVITAIYMLPSPVANFTQYNPKLSSLQLTVGYRFSD